MDKDELFVEPVTPAKTFKRLKRKGTILSKEHETKRRRTPEDKPKINGSPVVEKEFASERKVAESELVIKKSDNPERCVAQNPKREERGDIKQTKKDMNNPALFYNQQMSDDPDCTPADVTGIVSEVVKKKKINGQWERDKKFKVYATASGKYLDCVCSTYCDVETEDLIYGIGFYNKREELFYSADTPIIEPGMTKSSFSKFIVSQFPGKRMDGMTKASVIYTTLRNNPKVTRRSDGTEKGTANAICLFMTEMATDYKKNPIETASTSIFGAILTQKQSAMVLIGWYNKRILRQLMMLGLNKKEIDDSSYPVEILYDKTRKNPFTVPFLTHEKCVQLSARFKLNVTVDQVRKGTICRFIWEQCEKNGWAGVPMHTVAKNFSDFLKFEDDLIALRDPEADTAHGYGLAVSEINSRKLVYLRSNMEDEIFVAAALAEKVKAHAENKEKKIINPDYRLESLTDDQKEAIYGILNSAVGILTGPAGSGKTTTLTEIVHNLENMMVGYGLFSHTGKAVTRMKQLLKEVGLPKTVYSKTYTLDRAIRKGVHCLPEMLTHVVVDETSMVTTPLFANFLRTFTDVKWIVMVGDVNQLLPIGWGSLFSECINSNRFPFYKLSQIHRVYHVEGEVDGIVENCNRIANAPDDVTITLVERDNFSIQIGNQEDLERAINCYHEGKVKDHQVAILSPYNRRQNVEIREEINDFAQSVFRKPKKGHIRYTTDTKNVRWTTEDLVIMRENNYDIDVMNGETGRVLGITATHLIVSFDEEAVNNLQPEGKYQRTFYFALEIPEDYSSLSYKDKNELMLSKKEYKETTGFSAAFALEENVDEEYNLHCGYLLRSYCLTIHKSQGSEWDFVILYLPPGAKASPYFLHKKLLYTAVSRAKRAVYIVCEDKQVLENIINTNPAKRHELLSLRLESSIEKSDKGFDRSNLLIGHIPEDQAQAFEEHFQNYDDEDYDEE